MGGFVGDEVGGEVGDEVGAAVGNAVGASVGDEVGNEVGDAVGAEVGAPVATFFSMCIMSPWISSRTVELEKAAILASAILGLTEITISSWSSQLPVTHEFSLGVLGEPEVEYMKIARTA